MPIRHKIICKNCGQKDYSQAKYFCSYKCRAEYVIKETIKNPHRKCCRCKKLYKINIERYLKNRHITGYCYNCKKIMDREYRIKNGIKVYETKQIWYLKNKKKPYQRWLRLKHTAKTRNLQFDITSDDFIKWYENIPKICTYCGIPQEHLSCPPIMFDRFHKELTFDRMNNEKGYYLDNITLACQRCNFIKSNILTFDEMMEIGEKYIKPKWQNKLQEVI